MEISTPEIVGKNEKIFILFKPLVVFVLAIPTCFFLINEPSATIAPPSLFAEYFPFVVIGLGIVSIFRYKPTNKAYSSLIRPLLFLSILMVSGLYFLWAIKDFG